MITMAIKYVVIPEKKTVIAILKNTKLDAYYKAMKICRGITEGCPNVYICPNPDKLMMPNEFKGVAICKDNDVFDEEVGKGIAKRICMRKYYNSFDKKIAKFKDDLHLTGIRTFHETNRVEEDYE